MNFFHPELNIGSECVLSILEDSSRRVWIGTDGDGIYRLNADREVDRHYTADKLPAGVVLTIFEDSRGRIWLGTYLHGLFLYDERSDSFQSIRLQTGGREIKDIYIIEENTDGTLWIGTNENGLCLYNHDTKKLEATPTTCCPKAIRYPATRCIRFSSGVTVWCGLVPAAPAPLVSTRNRAVP